jgi:hypothetical protein
MQSIAPSRTLKYYQLVKMATKANLYLSLVGSSATNSVGIGFFHTLTEAEHIRTTETLKDQDGSTFHIFELEFPNPAYKE